MFHQVQMLFLVTGQCNMACPHCAQGYWRRDHMNYHMTPEEVRTICSRTKELGMHFAQALIMGGEPALWRHLEEGCRVIRESGVFDQIHIYSNCKNPDPIINLLDKGLADRVATQTVNMSEAGIQKIQEKHPQSMLITKQDEHRIHPDKPLPGAWPALCGCDQITVFDWKVWSCPGAYHNTVRIGSDIDNPRLWAGIGEDWHTYLERMDRYGIMACGVCLSNGRIGHLTKTGNRRGELS